MNLTDTIDFHDMPEIVKYEKKLIKLSEDHSAYCKTYAMSEGVLDIFYAQNASDISEMTGKKFIGADSMHRILLQFADKEGGEVKSKIDKYYKDMKMAKSNIDGIRGEMKAVTTVLDVTRSKMSYEKSQTN